MQTKFKKMHKFIVCFSLVTLTSLNRASAPTNDLMAMFETLRITMEKGFEDIKQKLNDHENRLRKLESSPAQSQKNLEDEAELILNQYPAHLLERVRFYTQAMLQANPQVTNTCGGTLGPITPIFIDSLDLYRVVHRKQLERLQNQRGNFGRMF
jgi:hypothetical protein